MRRRTNGRWNEEYARQVLGRASKSGKSDSEMARELGVSPQRIHWWRRRLEELESAMTPPFVEVTVTASPEVRPFVVQSRCGRSVSIWPGFDASELGRLLDVLEDSSC